MRHEEEAGRTEEREWAWHRYEDALSLLHFAHTRRILTVAHGLNR